eukprot:m.22368 g.22368  ORF g.22368 m.22368 type:complete len:737 (-) comp5805_c0_seq2:342-2552(-)
MSAVQSRPFAKGGRNGVRVLKLKNFVPVAVPENTRQQSLDTLIAAVQAIHNSTPIDPSHTLEILYKEVEVTCVQGGAERLYGRLKTLCRDHLKGVAAELKQHTCKPQLEFIRDVDASWNTHCNQMGLIRSIFLYMDRSYALPTPNVAPLWDMGLVLLREEVIGRREILSPLQTALLGAVQSDRVGERMDRSMLKRLLKMLDDLSLYAEHFEAGFLSQSSLFFEAEAKTKIDELDVAEYLQYVEVRLQEEAERAEQCLQIGSRKPLIAEIEKYLIGNHVTEILRKGLCPMLEEDRLDDLVRLFNLFKRVAALDSLMQGLVTYATERGKTIVLDESRDKFMIDDLLVLKKKLDTVVSGPFRAAPEFVDSIRTTFQDIVNCRHNRPAEMMAKFFDSKLRTGYKECSEDELEDMFDRVMVLFRFLNGKDVFVAFYKQLLARRLLLQKTASDDAERSILSKLKQECGAVFTAKLEGMFKDVNLSVDLTATFRLTARRKCASTIDMSVNVLTASNWPTMTPTDVSLPPEIVELQTLFTEYYCSKHANRKLIWEPFLGHCLVHGNFEKGSKDLTMSIYQGLVLLAFNSADSYTCTDLQRLLRIEPADLGRVLQSLACGKVRVLTKTPKGRQVAATDVFEVNNNFENKHKRVKINQIQMKETAAENSATQEKVFADRAFAVDAAIVRVMKARKTLPHNQLITALFEQLKFPVKPADLKKRIENLIEREYMARDPKDNSMYNYVA